MLSKIALLLIGIFCASAPFATEKTMFMFKLAIKIALGILDPAGADLDGGKDLPALRDLFR